jgi:hypothetical protein
METRINYPPIIEGFTEGLFAPLFELIVDVFVTALNSISSATGASSMVWFIALFSIMDVLRNAVVCYFHSQFAIGNVFGNILGILLFYGAIKTVSPEAATSSLLLTIILVISLIIGIFVTAWRAASTEE